MISGAHVIIYSKDAEADKGFFRDILGLENVDVGGGWLIFALPPSEAAVHPSETNSKHQLYLMCDDIEEFISDANAKGVECGPIREERWGILTSVTLPGGGSIEVYQPKHERPSSASSR
ncbi:MAG: hypothetical protein R2684_15570 [Pyrinomonadaceae bacterium]